MIAFDQQPLDTMKRCVLALSRPVKVMLRPPDSNVLLEKHFGSPVFTIYGITVAKEVELEDPFESRGVSVVRDVAAKRMVSPGTGQPPRLCGQKRFFSEALKAVAVDIRSVCRNRGFETSVEDIVEEPHKTSKSKQVKGKAQLTKVATIAANNDELVGEHVAEALDKIA